MTTRATPESLCFEVRDKLEITQLELSQMLGIHPVTVARWESTRGKCKLEPNEWQQECLKTMVRGIESRPKFRNKVWKALDQEKPLLAFYLSLAASLGGRATVKERTENGSR